MSRWVSGHLRRVMCHSLVRGSVIGGGGGGSETSFAFAFEMSRSINTATGYALDARVRFPAGARFCLLHCVQTGSGTDLSNGYRGKLPER
jgi:hypothetical protein